MNISNPKVLVFFLAFLPQFVDKGSGLIELQLMMLGSIFIVITLLVFSGVAVLSGSLGLWLRESPRAGLILNRTAGLVFIGLALKLVIS